MPQGIDNVNPLSRWTGVGLLELLDWLHWSGLAFVSGCVQPPSKLYMKILISFH